MLLIARSISELGWDPYPDWDWGKASVPPGLIYCPSLYRDCDLDRPWLAFCRDALYASNLSDFCCLFDVLIFTFVSYNQ